MVKLRDLQYLDAIGTHQHFGRAAEACCVSQPTLSGQIIRLEEQLGLQLVERHKRKIMLTPAGEQLLLEARKVLSAAASFEDSASALKDPLSGDLHVGMIPTLAPYLLPHIMEPLHQALPKVNFYLYENKTKNLLTELNDGKLDLLVLPWLDEMQAFERYDLFDESFVLTVYDKHALANKKSIELADLNGLEVLTLEDGHCLRDQALGYCFTAGASEDQRFQGTSLETLRYMVGSNLGTTLLPELAILSSEKSTSLRYIPFADPKPSRQISLLIRPNYPRMELIRAVVRSIRESMAQVISEK